MSKKMGELGMRISRRFRDARLISIGGGASEVMSESITKTYGF